MSSTDFRCVITHQCGKRRKMLQDGIETQLIIRQSQGSRQLSIRKGIFKYIQFLFYVYAQRLPEFSIYLKNLALYSCIYNSSIIDIELCLIIPQNLIHNWLTKWVRDDHGIFQYIYIYILHGGICDPGSQSMKLYALIIYIYIYMCVCVCVCGHFYW